MQPKAERVVEADGELVGGQRLGPPDQVGGESSGDSVVLDMGAVGRADEGLVVAGGERPESGFFGAHF